jgi:hypothetical protein
MKIDFDKAGLAAKAVSAVDKVVELPEPAAMVFSDVEQLEKAFVQIQDDGESMLNRMASLEPVEPGLVKLESLIEQHFPGATDAGMHSIIKRAHEEYQDAKRAINDIDSIATTAEFIVVLSAAAALAPEGITLPAALALAAKGGKDFYDMVVRLKQANAQIDVVIELAAKLADTRVEFDRMWSEIQNEDSRLESAHPEE